MDILSAWFLFPSLLLLISSVLGVAIRSLSKEYFHPALAFPIGFAALIVYLELMTYWSFSARFALPLLALIFFISLFVFKSELPKFIRNFGPHSLIAGITYLLYSLPIWASGKPTFAGWIKLDDGSTWLAFADRLFEAGRNTTGLPLSTYEAVLQINLTSSASNGPGYPVGAFLPLGGLSKVLKVDPAWTLQPYMACAAAILSLLIFVALNKTFKSKVVCGIAAISSSCSALLFGYAMWGGAKELVMAPLIGLTMYLATTFSLSSLKRSPLALLPFAISASSVIAIAGLVGGVWIAPPLVVLVGKIWRNHSVRENKTPLLIFLLSAVFLILPSLLLSNILNIKALLNFTKGSNDIGNLVGPLDRKEILGIWPTGDFRFAPTNFTKPFNLVLIIVSALALLGIYASWKNKQHFFYLMTLSSLIFSFIFSFGNAWIAGKCFAMSSPFVLMSAFYGIAFLFKSTKRIEAALALLLVTGGVLLSLVMIFHEVWLAPYDQLKDLQQIGADTRLASPALMIEYSPYGVRHFLRHLAPEGAGELRRHLIPLKSGNGLEKGAYADVDDFQLSSIESYNTLVLRRSPIASRPPSNYSLMYALPYYEVWEKNPSSRHILEHISYGNDENPSAIQSCTSLMKISHSAPSGTLISSVIRSPNLILNLAQSTLPSDWSAGSTPGTVLPQGSGEISLSTTIAHSGNYLLWIGGSYRGALKITVDGKSTFFSSSSLTHTNSFSQIGALFLSAGVHHLDLKYSTSWLSPGSGGPAFELGPIALSKSPADLPVTTIEPSQIKTLCGKSLDWIEVVR